MRLSEYGRREQFAALWICLACALGTGWVIPWASALWGIPLLCVLWFFRDPERRVPTEADLVVAPADGIVRDIRVVREPNFLRREATRIGIFMPVWGVHVNRAPAAGSVEWLHHESGKFLDARLPEASDLNERQEIGIASGSGAKILVRQIAGRVAQRIVCAVRVGERLDRGMRLGMIKFGSRVELLVPLDLAFELSVVVGQKVVAGETVLGHLPGGESADATTRDLGTAHPADTR